MEIRNWLLLSTECHTRNICLVFVIWLLNSLSIKGLPELCDVGIASGFASKCIFVGTSLSSWTSGRKFCQMFGGDLISIHSEDSEKELAQRLEQSNGDSHESHALWIGLNDLRNPGIFEWTDGSAVNYTRWQSQIQKWNPENDTGSCVFLNAELTWDITNCSLEGSFVCLENSFVLESEGCDEGMTRFGNSCYWLLLDDDNWNVSEAWCASENGHLVAINDELENMFIYNIIMTKKTGYWIGLHHQNDSGLMWTTKEYSSYSNWVGSPDMSPGNCPVISRGGKWIMQSCSSNHPGAICEKPLNRTPAGQNDQCPDGWQKLENKCYMIEEKSLLSWNDASSHCLGLKSQLASFNTIEDEQYIFRQTPDNESDSQYWIGLKCTDNTLDITWTDGSPLTYDMHDITQQDKIKIENPDVSEFCIAHSPQSQGWFCLPCDFRIGSACSQNVPTHQDYPGQELRTIPSGTFETPFCPLGWATFAHNCYILVQSSLNWETASSECKRLESQSNLVSIHSPQQQEFLTELMVNNNLSQVWTGLSDKTGQQLFRWSDGSFVDYNLRISTNTNTDAIERKWENCVTMNTMKVWEATECVHQYPFICQQVNTVILPVLDATMLPSTWINVVDQTSENDSPSIDVVKEIFDPTVPSTMDLDDYPIYEINNFSLSSTLGMTAGMSGGTIAGIVLGCLILTALLIIGFIYLYQRNYIIRAVKTKLSFENHLYNPYGDQIQLHPTVREATTESEIKDVQHPPI